MTGPERTDLALVLGGADSLWPDVRALEAVIGGPWPGVVIAVNNAGYAWTRRLDHWVSLHGTSLPAWAKERKDRGLPGGFTTWAPGRVDGVDRAWRNGWEGGSSGLYAVGIALAALGIPRVVLCGVPMDSRPNLFRGEAWRWHGRYVYGWREHMEEMLPVVRSMSGQTRQWFGVPSLEWLDIAAAAVPGE